jgi:hypothetical protein
VALLDVDPYNIPRFRLRIPDINFGLLISKALFIEAQHDGYFVDYETTKNKNIRE